jgi:aldose 1-epimerase
VQVITLANKKGMSVEILTYGATIKELRVPDREGKVGNVVHTTDSIEKYEKFNASASVIGRVANRIKGARFELNGEVFKLIANSGKNSIHGGKPGFDRVVWALENAGLHEGNNTVTLSYLSPDGEAGFPGNLLTKVTYTLTEKNELRLEYRATTDRPTLVNLTNHAYFNLAGGGTALDHVLVIPAGSYTPSDRESIPTGEIRPVKDTPLDFTKATRLGERLDQLRPQMNGYDHNYVLKEGRTPKFAARLAEPKSGRVMEIWTTQPGIQLYTGNHLGHRAVCLETQHFPDAIHHKNFPSTVVTPEKGYEEVAIYRFSVDSRSE